jgi:DNA-binding NarL/FixJ family response regulator
MPQETRPRVLLADDHAGILSALKRMLQPSCEVVESVTDGIAAVEAAARLKPDVLVLDLAMPGMGGIDACRQIKQATPNVKVVILTANNDPDLKREAFSVGASAFVLKKFMAEELLNAIRTAFLGDGRRPVRE